MSCLGCRAGGTGIGSRRCVSRSQGLLSCSSVCGLLRHALCEGRDQGCHPLLVAQWLANCLVVIGASTHCLSLTPPLPYCPPIPPPSATPGPEDRVFAGDLQDLKFCGNWRLRVKSILIIMQMPSFSNPLNCLPHADECLQPPLGFLTDAVHTPSPIQDSGALTSYEFGPHCCA